MARPSHFSHERFGLHDVRYDVGLFQAALLPAAAAEYEDHDLQDKRNTQHAAHDHRDCSTPPADRVVLVRATKRGEESSTA